MRIDSSKVAIAIKNYMAENNLTDQKFIEFSKIAEITFYNIMRKQKIRFLTAVKVCKAIGIENIAQFLEA